MTAAVTGELVRAGEVRELAPPRITATALNIEEMIALKKLVAQCVSELMKDGEHFGVIPGTEKKNDRGQDISKRVLFKAGADLLCSLFQLEADYATEEAIRRPDFIYYRLKCTLTSAATGIKRGSGLGSCNSREEKYIRAAARKCPNCGKEAIIKGKEEYGGGWLCFKKKGGCGGKWADGAEEIEQQDTGVKDPSDLDNTILKMAAKRARVDAVLTVTGASDFFTQDVDDLTEREAGHAPQATPPERGAEGKAGTAPIATGATTKASGAPPASSSGTATAPQATGTSKPAAKANTIKHDGKKASAEQVKLLHVLRGKLGIPECSGPGQCVEPYQEWSKSANGLVDKMRYCEYHTRLHAFKDQKGDPILSSKELCPAQISHFISYYEAKLAKREQSTREIREAHGDPPAVDMTELAASMADKGVSEDDLCGFFGKDSITRLDREESADALALVIAWDTDRWELVRDAVRDKIEAKR